MRVDIDEYDIPRFVPDAQARAVLKGQSKDFFPLRFVRIEPYVIPKKSLTGDNTERVDTRVLQVIYAVDGPTNNKLFDGQQVDVFIDASPPAGRIQGAAGIADADISGPDSLKFPPLTASAKA